MSLQPSRTGVVGKTRVHQSKSTYRAGGIGVGGAGAAGANSGIHRLHLPSQRVQTIEHLLARRVRIADCLNIRDYGWSTVRMLEYFNNAEVL